jgi:hypothetical protein
MCCYGATRIQKNDVVCIDINLPRLDVLTLFSKLHVKRSDDTFGI